MESTVLCECSPLIYFLSKKVFLFIFAVLKRFVVCVCNFGGFGYGFFDLWIQFREYAFDDANVLENSTLPF